MPAFTMAAEVSRRRRRASKTAEELIVAVLAASASAAVGAMTLTLVSAGVLPGARMVTLHVRRASLAPPPRLLPQEPLKS